MFCQKQHKLSGLNISAHSSPCPICQGKAETSNLLHYFSKKHSERMTNMKMSQLSWAKLKNTGICSEVTGTYEEIRSWAIHTLHTFPIWHCRGRVGREKNGPQFLNILSLIKPTISKLSCFALHESLKRNSHLRRIKRSMVWFYFYYSSFISI